MAIPVFQIGFCIASCKNQVQNLNLSCKIRQITIVRRKPQSHDFRMIAGFSSRPENLLEDANILLEAGVKIAIARMIDTLK